MLKIEQIRAALEDRNLRVVAEKTGLHYNTVRAIARGESDNPSYDTLHALVSYLEGTRVPDA